MGTYENETMLRITQESRFSYCYYSKYDFLNLNKFYCLFPYMVDLAWAYFWTVLYCRGSSVDHTQPFSKSSFWPVPTRLDTKYEKRVLMEVTTSHPLDEYYPAKDSAKKLFICNGAENKFENKTDLEMSCWC